jgi:hypothetical protein
MLVCKSMATPMGMNLKFLVDTSSELVDATLYTNYWFVDVCNEY